MKQRNYSIDLVKCYLALLIAVSHTPFPSTLPSFSAGLIVVLFFLLSGYFLVGSFDSGKYATPWDYTLSRVKRIWPYYAAAFVVMYLYVNRAGGLRDLVLNFCRSLPELLMLQSTGIFEGGINYPMWQLCTLVLVSHVFFSLLQWNRQVTLNGICPVTALVCYTYYIQVTETTALPFVYVPLVRAAGAVAMGMAVYTPIRMAVDKLRRFALPPVLVDAAGIFTLLLLWTNRMTYSVILPFVGLLIWLLSGKGLLCGLLRHPVLGKLDRLTLGIYLNHALIVRLFEDYPLLYEHIPLIPNDLFYLLVVVLYTLVMMKAVDAVGTLCKKWIPGKELAA